ncbi:MAG: hypothetical protein WC209_09600 [Ignavibacteriaceae bacterium]|jgi:hypothetical protein
MKARIVLGFIVMMFVLALPVNAGGKSEIQKYFNDAANKVKATENTTEKRTILDESLKGMSKVLNVVQSSPLISNEDATVISRIKASLQEKQNELTGDNGFTRIPDSQLNNFSNYIVQSMEQAETINISLVALLLIIILVVLLV